MTSTREKQSFLNRLRGTPKSLRRRLGLSAENVETTKGNGFDSPSSGPRSPVKQRTNNKDEFYCRFLGERTVYTLKPEDCYQFALDLEKNTSEKSLTKATVKIGSKSLEISYQPPSPVLVKQKSKHGLFTPPPGSPGFLRKQNSVSSSRTNSDNFSPLSPPPATTIFDTPYYQQRMTSVDDFSVLTKSRGEFNNNHHHLADSEMSPGEHCNNVFDVFPRQRSHTFNGPLDSHTTGASPDKVLLHDIAYCVTLPVRPRIFLLTSRGRDALTCRALLFARRDKAEALKLSLASQFQQSYREWQAKCQRKISVSPTKCDISPAVVARLQSLSNSSVSDVSDDDVSVDDVMTEEEESQHREFVRRASCLPNPDQLSVGGNSLEMFEDQLKLSLNNAES